jgi:PAS domain S-box-containing protein
MTLPRKRRYAPVWLIFCAGSFLSVVSFLIVGNWEKANQKIHFQNQADRLATTLQQSINSNLELLKATGRFYGASERVERQEFKFFIKDFLVNYPSIYAFNWTARISAKERQAFEQGVRAEGYSSFKVLEQETPGKMVEAGMRQEYFPITYVEAQQTPSKVLGYDLASEPMRRSALDKARDTGTVTTTGCVQIITIDRSGFLAFQPVYRKGTSTDSLQARRQNFLGVTTSVVLITDLVKTALQRLELENIDFYLMDDSATAKDRFLSFYDSRTKQLIVPPGREPAVKIGAESFCSNRAVCTRLLNVADRQWSLLVLPESGYMSVHTYWRTWATLFFGLFLTSLVTAYLLMSLRHTVQVEQLVCERTTQAELLDQILNSLRQNLEMLDFASDAIILWDLNDRIAYWNRGAERLYGWKKEEVLGQDINTFLQTIFPQPLEEIVAVSRREGRWEGELIQTKRDGTQIVVESRWTLQRDELGCISVRLEINHDITAKKQVEEDLRRSQRFNQQIADTTPNILYIYDLIEKRNVYTNREIAKTLGYTPEAIEQMDASLMRNLLHPDDFDRIIEHHNHLATLTSKGIFEIEYRMKAASGEWHWLRSRETVFSTTPLGMPQQILGSAEDITERKRAEEELRQSEAKFREIAQREALLNQLASQIRRSLDLNTILETTVHEIRNLLQIDRCFFLWYRPSTTTPVWEVVTESKTSAFPSLINYCVPVTTFGPLTTRVFNKEITRVDSVRTLTDPIERKFFFTIGYTALLALPIHTTSGEIGVVSCGHSGGARPWQDSEVELLQAVADQLAIAIDQAQLYKQCHIAATTAQDQAAELEKALHELQQTQAQLVQSEKMSSLGQLVAGVAHEINNPINFIYGNLTYVHGYAEDLLNLIRLYQAYYPHPAPEIQASAAAIEIDFIQEDLPKTLSSMSMGTERIRNIVLSLRNFSRLDEAEMKWVDIHEGLDNTLVILAHRLKAQQPECPDVRVIKDYGNLPLVQCYAGQLNQVFMNILSNAIDAIEEFNQERCVNDVENHPGVIWICTAVSAECNQVIILIGDSGLGMTREVCNRLFEPFFTTKPVGSGPGLGLSISYKIVVEKHGGQLQCISAPGQGAVFLIYIPIAQ